MLNIDTIKIMRKTPVLKERVKEVKKEVLIIGVRKKSLMKVLDAIKAKDKINRKGILDQSGLSGHCVTRCLTYLVDSGAVLKIKTGGAGPHDTSDYKVKK